MLKRKFHSDEYNLKTKITYGNLASDEEALITIESIPPRFKKVELSVFHNTVNDFKNLLLKDKDIDLVLDKSLQGV